MTKYIPYSNFWDFITKQKVITFWKSTLKHISPSLYSKLLRHNGTPMCFPSPTKTPTDWKNFFMLGRSPPVTLLMHCPHSNLPALKQVTPKLLSVCAIDSNSLVHYAFRLVSLLCSVPQQLPHTDLSTWRHWIRHHFYMVVVCHLLTLCQPSTTFNIMEDYEIRPEA